MEKILVIALLVSAAACGGNKNDTSTTTTSTGVGEGRGGQVVSITVTNTDWKHICDGACTIVSASTKDKFDGEFDCSASSGTDCPNSETAGGYGRLVYQCLGKQCGQVEGGTAAAGEKVCCGSVQGAGGDASVSYSK